MTSSFADTVASLCVEQYEKQLPKRGKPQSGREWTLLAAVCMTTNQGGIKVVAMGTGSKCIGQSKMSRQGTVINDSHAEVIARRAFLRYLYSELGKVYGGNPSKVFQHPDSTGRCRLHNGIKFHLFTSHTPCGDASIFPKERENETKCDSWNRGEEISTDKPTTQIKRTLDGSGYHGNQTNDSVMKKVKRNSQQCNESDCKQSSRYICSQTVCRDSPPGNTDASPSSLTDCIASDSGNTGACSHSLTDYVAGYAGPCSQTDSVASNSSNTGPRPQTDCTSSHAKNIGTHSQTDYAASHSKNTGPYSQTDCIASHSTDMNKSTGRMEHTKDADTIQCNVQQTNSTITTNTSNLVSEGKSHHPDSNPDRDIHRTGAKCVPRGNQDPHQPGLDYHTVGILRTKPGRGDPTLSMSCSDKIAKWNILGLQGAVLTHFMHEPVYLDSVIVGRCPYDSSAMDRALVSRCKGVTELPDNYRLHQPLLIQSNIIFPHCKSHMETTHNKTLGKLAPCGAAIIWCAVEKNNLEVSVNGYKQGYTAKKLNTPQARCSVCSHELFTTFKALLSSIPEDRRPDTLKSSQLKTYGDYKDAAIQYQQARTKLLAVFDTWLQKPRQYYEFS
ncbi:tRNA-specific adenosine deaminase 1-like [Glandiceps talaboti]